ESLFRIAARRQPLNFLLECFASFPLHRELLAQICSGRISFRNQRRLRHGRLRSWWGTRGLDIARQELRGPASGIGGDRALPRLLISMHFSVRALRGSGLQSLQLRRLVFCPQRMNLADGFVEVTDLAQEIGVLPPGVVKRSAELRSRSASVLQDALQGFELASRRLFLGF